MSAINFDLRRNFAGLGLLTNRNSMPTNSYLSELMNGTGTMDLAQTLGVEYCKGEVWRRTCGLLP